MRAATLFVWRPTGSSTSGSLCASASASVSLLRNNEVIIVLICFSCSVNQMQHVSNRQSTRPSGPRYCLRGDFRTRPYIRTISSKNIYIYMMATKLLPSIPPNYLDKTDFLKLSSRTSEFSSCFYRIYPQFGSRCHVVSGVIVCDVWCSDLNPFILERFYSLLFFCDLL